MADVLIRNNTVVGAGENIIDDANTASNKVWSSEKVSNEISEINTKLTNKTTTSRDIADSSEGGLLIHHIDGASVQNGTPTPTSPVPIESVSVKVKTQGKNLISYPYIHASGRVSQGITYTVNPDGSVTLNGTATGTSTFNFSGRGQGESSLSFKDGKSYRISGQPQTTGVRLLINYTNQSGSAQTLISSSTPTIFDYENVNPLYNFAVYISIASGTVCENVVVKPMITEVNADGTYPTTFEKGYTSVADTSLVLRSIGDIKDELIFEDNKYKVIRRVDEFVYDGSENWTSNPAGSKQRLLLTDSRVPTYTELGRGNWAEGSIKSNMLEECTSSATQPSSGTAETIALHSSSHLIQLMADAYQDATSWKSHLAQNNLVVTVRKATPTVEELTDDAIKLLGLKSWNEQTHITLDSAIDTPITLEYATNNGNGRGLNGYTVALANEIKLNQLTMATMLSE